MLDGMRTTLSLFLQAKMGLIAITSVFMVRFSKLKVPHGGLVERLYIVGEGGF